MIEHGAINLNPLKHVGAERARLRNNCRVAENAERHAREKLDASNTMTGKGKWHRAWKWWARSLLMHRAALEEFDAAQHG